ncbi:hypothetical protein HPB52_021194 [Rhipicephalus sanguineus]|uniref:Uncharacterized protein n=1 Tax=Rhipicephalus sanguineus TaxID=34632 RepID=A0A9D4PQC5_RHISA|nr:hypothetical protein HPB52_021194 [Rhipicephalus sanguineus]
MEADKDTDIIEVMQRKPEQQAGDIVVYEVHDSDSEFSDVLDESSVLVADSSAVGDDTSILEIVDSATFNNKDLVLLNTHLESMGYSSEVRQMQLRRCFRQCRKEPPGKTVILGGDMNLRDHEVDSIGGLPDGIQDAWTACGSDPGSCYTWDMMCNDNLDFGKKVTARLRFDRVYVRHSEPAHLMPVFFKLIGQKRLETEQCFPSDHWGVAVQFKCL